MSVLDVSTTALIRLAAAVAAGDETDVREACAACNSDSTPEAVEEIILQSYLFAGFPRALNAMRIWRAVSGRPAPTSGDEGDRDAWPARGERTCAVVYGEAYDRLRHNIRALHPALDDWMIVDGYGKVLSREGLDLKTRELAIVATCAASAQQRQLHSHLHGALNAGATERELSATLDAITPHLGDRIAGYRHLLDKVLAVRADVR